MTYQWSKEDIQKIKAAWANDAGRLALETVLKAAGLHGHIPTDAELPMHLAVGRRALAVELAHIISTPIDKLIPEEHDYRRHGPLTATERAARAAASTD